MFRLVLITETEGNHDSREDVRAHSWFPNSRPAFRGVSRTNSLSGTCKFQFLQCAGLSLSGIATMSQRTLAPGAWHSRNVCESRACLALGTRAKPGSSHSSLRLLVTGGPEESVFAKGEHLPRRTRNINADTRANLRVYSGRGARTVFFFSFSYRLWQMAQLSFSWIILEDVGVTFTRNRCVQLTSNTSLINF